MDFPINPGNLPNPGIKPKSPTLQADSLPSEPPGKPKNIGVGSQSPLQGIFPNPGIEPRSRTLQADSLAAEPPGKPKNIGVGSLSLFQGIFPNPGIEPGSPALQETQVLIPGLGSFPGNVMATWYSILAWEILWIEEPGRLKFMGSQKSQTQYSN